MTEDGGAGGKVRGEKGQKFAAQKCQNDNSYWALGSSLNAGDKLKGEWSKAAAAAAAGVEPEES